MTGAHPTLAGVVLGMMTPTTPSGMREHGGDVASRTARRELLPPVVRVQMALHPWVAYGVMPLFALANAGISVSGAHLASGRTGWVTLGVALALVAGKPIGVIGVSGLMVRFGWCRLPSDVSWGGIVLVGLLAGVGFTMSIFIATIAFGDSDLLDAAKLGILLGSLVAAALGLMWGTIYMRRIATTHDGRRADSSTSKGGSADHPYRRSVLPAVRHGTRTESCDLA